MPNLIQSFSDFQFAPPVVSALNSMNFEVPTPIQQQTIQQLTDHDTVNTSPTKCTITQPINKQ
jgi:superfamily II DNA/RNA helicase